LLFKKENKTDSLSLVCEPNATLSLKRSK